MRAKTLEAFALPALTADQRSALTIAVSRIGYPYVWGGTTDDTSDGLAHGGFDCSGFVWRVFKSSGLPWGKSIGGRTAAQQADEIAKSRRLSIGSLEPADLLFFGTASFRSTATESTVTHEGIYLGDNWVINASGQGVYVEPLAGGWLGDSFAWAVALIRPDNAGSTEVVDTAQDRVNRRDVVAHRALGGARLVAADRAQDALVLGDDLVAVERLSACGRSATAAARRGSSRARHVTMRSLPAVTAITR